MIPFQERKKNIITSTINYEKTYEFNPKILTNYAEHVNT